MWSNSDPGYILSTQNKSIRFECTWGDLHFLFLEQPNSSYNIDDNSGTVIQQTAPFHENQHIVHLSAFTMLQSSAVSQPINYPMPILSQRHLCFS